MAYSRFIGLITISILSIAPVHACTGQDEYHPKQDGWSLVWSDEFDGDTIDTAKWSHEIDCWGGGNDERQCYVDWPENSYVSDGCLTIAANLEPVTGPAWPEHIRAKGEVDPTETKDQLFTSARLRTKNKAEWTYGRVEVRAKLPAGQGLWPAIWMLPTEEIYGAWALSGEIDIVEAVNLSTPCKSCRGGQENRVHGTIHYGGEWPQNKYKGNPARLTNNEDGSQKFHVFAVEWSEGRIRWFLDGKPYGTINSRGWSPLIGGLDGKREAPFDQPFHLILNLAVGGTWPEAENEKGVALDIFPAEMQVDWIRVYECAGDLTAKACRS